MKTRAIAISLVVITVVGLGVGGSFAVTPGGDAQDGDAQVRVAHLSPDAPAVDVLVDGDAVLEGAEFRDVSDYLNLSAEEHQITVQTSENETVIFQGNMTFDAGTKTTVATIGEASEDALEVVFYADDFEQPSEENASVRLIHASPDAPAVDVTVAEGNAVLFDNVSFGNATDYVGVPEGNYTLEVRPATAENDGDVVATFNVTLESQTVYTAIAAGYLSPEEAPANESFDLLVVVDSEAGAMMGGEMANETTTTEA